MTDTARMMQYDANKKSDVVAYLLWFSLGYFGAHRFYLNLYVSGAVLLIITLTSIVLMLVLVGFIIMLIPFFWWIVDLFLISRNIRKYNVALAAKLEQ